MAVNGLDHINIQTRSLAETVRFFADVLDLTPGDPPAGLDPARIQWMFDAAGRPLFHLSTPGSLLTGDAASGVAHSEGTGALHHVALDCSGHAAMIERLDRLGIAYRTTAVPSIDLKQVFIHEPNGVLLELNFRSGQH